MEPQRANIVLLGATAVGRSSLAHRYAKGQFVDQPMGVATALVTKTIPNLNLKLLIWETDGQERYQGLARMYYRNAHAAVIVYDITSQYSFSRAQFWVHELQQQQVINPNLIIALAGNKADLEADRSVATAMAQFYAKENGLHFMEISAKTAANVDDVFTTIAEQLTQLPLPAPVGPPTKEKKGWCTIM